MINSRVLTVIEGEGWARGAVVPRRDSGWVSSSQYSVLMSPHGVPPAADHGRGGSGLDAVHRVMVEGFGVEGIAECGGEGRYEVVSAIRVIQKRQSQLLLINATYSQYNNVLRHFYSYSAIDNSRYPS
jgi:hypothetical protein